MVNVNNKRPVESFIVATTGTTLKVASQVNLSSGAVDLANGQIGVAAGSDYGTVARNAFLPTSATIDSSPTILIYQGTGDSAAPSLSATRYPLTPRPYEVSMPIIGKTNVQVTKQVFRADRNAAVIVGKPTAATSGKIIPASDTDYTLKVAFSSFRTEEFFSGQQGVSIISTIRTPLGAAYTAIAQPIDWINSNLIVELNGSSAGIISPNIRRGRAPLAAIGLGNTAGVLISSITANSILPIMNTPSGARSIFVTPGILAAITLAAAAGPYTHVSLVDLATAGTAANTETILLIGLDHRTAFIDYIPQLKTDIRVGATEGLHPQLSIVKVSTPDEGQGSGRSLDLLYRATQGQRKYNLRHTTDAVNPEYPSPVNVNATYTTYVVHHGNSFQPDSFNMIYSPLKEIVLIPTADTTLQTNLETLLNTWLTSGDNQAIITI